MDFFSEVKTTPLVSLLSSVKKNFKTWKKDTFLWHVVISLDSCRPIPFISIIVDFLTFFRNVHVFGEFHSLSLSDLSLITVKEIEGWVLFGCSEACVESASSADSLMDMAGQTWGFLFGEGSRCVFYAKPHVLLLSLVKSPPPPLCPLQGMQTHSWPCLPHPALPCIPQLPTYSFRSCQLYTPLL